MAVSPAADAGIEQGGLLRRRSQIHGNDECLICVTAEKGEYLVVPAVEEFNRAAAERRMLPANGDEPPEPGQERVLGSLLRFDVDGREMEEHVAFVPSRKDCRVTSGHWLSSARCCR